MRFNAIWSRICHYGSLNLDFWSPIQKFCNKLVQLSKLQIKIEIGVLQTTGHESVMKGGQIWIFHHLSNILDQIGPILQIWDLYGIGMLEATDVDNFI